MYIQAAHTNISKTFAFHVHIRIHIGLTHARTQWGGLHKPPHGLPRGSKCLTQIAICAFINFVPTFSLMQFSTFINYIYFICIYPFPIKERLDWRMLLWTKNCLNCQKWNPYKAKGAISTPVCARK